MNITKRNKVALAIGTGALVVGTAGTAFAFWTSSGGTGDGSAATGSAKDLTITQDASPAVTGLSPNGPIDPIAFSVNNSATGAGAEFVHTVTVSIENSNLSAWSAQSDLAKPACTASDFAIAHAVQTVDQTIQPGDSFDQTVAVQGASPLTIQLVDNTFNQDNCQNVTPPLHYTSN